MHDPAEMPHLFTSYDMDGTEIEVLDFLYTFVRMTKPTRVLETGTWKAYGTVAFAYALRDNGFGELVTIENDSNLASKAEKFIKKNNLQETVTVVHSPSLSYIDTLDPSKHGQFDFAFFDSTRPDRPKEFENLMKKNMLKGFVGFHDTSRLRIENHKGKDNVQKAYVKALDDLEKKYAKGHLEFALSRGLRIFQA